MINLPLNLAKNQLPIVIKFAGISKTALLLLFLKLLLLFVLRFFMCVLLLLLLSLLLFAAFADPFGAFFHVLLLVGAICAAV